MKRAVLALAVLASVLAAGCLGSAGPTDGSVAVYVSDQPGAIEDFEHLNVTVTKIGLKRAGGWHGDHSGHRQRHRNKWVVYDVPDQTVDLTRLQGENATLLEDVSVANGTYKKVFIYVSDVNGTLKNASGSTSADVRLPGNRLKVKDRFTVEGGESVSFVVDVTVVERDTGYVIKPQVSKSGNEQPFCRCRTNCTCGNMTGMHDGGSSGTTESGMGGGTESGMGGMHDGGKNGTCGCH